MARPKKVPARLEDSAVALPSSPEPKRFDQKLLFMKDAAAAAVEVREYAGRAFDAQHPELPDLRRRHDELEQRIAAGKKELERLRRERDSIPRKVPRVNELSIPNLEDAS